MNEKESLEARLAHVQQELANVKAAIQNATGPTKAELEDMRKFFENSIVNIKEKLKKTKMKIRESYAVDPVVSVSMTMKGRKFGFRVVVEYKGKITSFFHEGNNQRAAEEAGRLLAMKIKYEK